MPRSVRMAVLALAAALTLGIAACGGDGDKLSKAELIKQADAICKANDEETSKLAEGAFEDPTSPKPEEIQAFLKKGVDVQRDATDKLKDLEPDDDTKDQWNKILDAVDDGTDKIEEAAETPEGSAEIIKGETDPYAEADRLGKELGLKECTSDD